MDDIAGPELLTVPVDIDDQGAVGHEVDGGPLDCTGR